MYVLSILGALSIGEPALAPEGSFDMVMRDILNSGYRELSQHR